MTHLDADYEMFRSIQDAMPLHDLRLSGPQDPAHWACPDCSQPCRCTDPLAQMAPHVRCGVVDL